MTKINLIIKHLIGYSVGISIFGILIPLGLMGLAVLSETWTNLHISGNQTLLNILAILMLMPGLTFMIWSNLSLFFIGKGGPTEGFGIAISPRTEKLVVSGPYKYSRNPMVFGAICCYLAISLLLNSQACLLTVLAFIAIVRQYLRIYEEKRLFRDFGDAFLEYRKQVPMIFPLLKNKN